MIQTATLDYPEVEQLFDKNLLATTLQRYLLRFDQDICAKAKKKIRSIDVGKSRRFKELSEKFKDLYERKTIEEIMYKEEIKNSSKRSSLSAAGGTCTFRRFRSLEGSI